MTEIQDDPLATALARLAARLEDQKGRDDSVRLAEQLEVHYRTIASSVAAERTRINRLTDAIEALREAPPISRTSVDTSSRVPGGRFVHRVIGRLISRHTGAVYEQLRARDELYRTALISALEAAIDILRGQNPTIDRRVATLADRMSELESRMSGGSGPAPAPSSASD